MDQDSSQNLKMSRINLQPSDEEFTNLITIFSIVGLFVICLSSIGIFIWCKYYRGFHSEDVSFKEEYSTSVEAVESVVDYNGNTLDIHSKNIQNFVETEITTAEDSTTTKVTSRYSKLLENMTHMDMKLDSKEIHITESPFDNVHVVNIDHIVASVSSQKKQQYDFNNMENTTASQQYDEKINMNNTDSLPQQYCSSQYDETEANITISSFEMDCIISGASTSFSSMDSMISINEKELSAYWVGVESSSFDADRLIGGIAGEEKLYRLAFDVTLDNSFVDGEECV